MLTGSGSSGTAWNIPDGVFSANGSDTGRQLEDVNGDGAPDLLVGDDGQRRAYLNQQWNADLLIRIDNGIGGSTAVTYQSSAGAANPNLPTPVTVIKSVTQNDGMGNSHTINFSFSEGYYSPTKREFRGFRRARVTDAAGNYQEHTFRPDIEALQGRAIQVAQYNSRGRRSTLLMGSVG